jgi:mycoredoxin
VCRKESSQLIRRTVDPAAKAFLRSVADGNETVPTVVVAGRALVNPSKRQLIDAARTYAPRALGTSR